MRGRCCRYGTKLDAVELVQEWLSTVASKASGNMQRAEILSGAIGAPESRLELELSFASLQELEVFWGTVPPAEHRLWSKKLQVTFGHHILMHPTQFACVKKCYRHSCYQEQHCQQARDA